jgi:hypothetical protein
MPVPNPIWLTEHYFNHNLKESAFFDEVAEEKWIDFAKYYLAQMEVDFFPHFLKTTDETDKLVRLYFEPNLAHYWDRAVERFYHPTPLLGVSPHPPPTPLDKKGVSTFLDPLKKHLLIAHSVFIRDNFYYCFDMIADSVDRSSWRSNPTTVDLVQRSILSIRRWLPILVELRKFIEDGILVFMPYYITPSFPYAGLSPKTKKEFNRLRLRPDPNPPATNSPRVDFHSFLDEPKTHPTARGLLPLSQDDAIAAWLNARILGLDVVLPDRESFEFSSRLYFHNDSEPLDVTTDLVSIEGLPFGDKTVLSLKELWKIRKNDEVFDELRNTVADCKLHLESNLPDGATKEAANEICRSFLGDQLKNRRGEMKLRFLETPGPSLVTSIVVALGVSVLTTNPFVGVVAGTALNPSFVRFLQNRVSKKRRAIGQLQALL